MSSHAGTSTIHRGQDLSTINEDTRSRGLTKSPEPHTSGIEIHGFKDTSARALSNEGSGFSKKPKRQSTINTNHSVVTNASASFEETEVWDQKALLALDGGGIRGYSALLILEALMKEIGKLERSHSDPATSSFHPLPPDPSNATDSESVKSQNPFESPQTESSPWLPCHYFDYVAGTSTGGLISIMLGRLRMNIDDCIRDYEYFGGKVFGHSRWFHIRSPLFWPRDKYNHKDLEKAVREVVERRVPYVASFPGGRNFAFDENRCRTVVLSYQRQKREVPEMPYIFRTYKNLHTSQGKEKLLDRNPGLAHDIPIWQVARATAAAPTYFEPPKTGNREYLDGGMGANNPCEELYGEVRRMNNGSNKCVRIILSIGTGKNNKAARFNGKGRSRYWNYMNWAKKWASDAQGPHERMLRLQRERKEFPYFRLNVEQGLDEMKLDEWRVRGALRTTVGKVVGSLRSSNKSSPHTNNCNNTQSDEVSAAEKNHGLLDAPKSLESSIPVWFQPKNMTLDSIRMQTNSYLAREDVKSWLRECAKILVEIRRNRAKKDPQRWEKACFGAWYQCQVEQCQRAEKEYGRREALMSHLKDKHSNLFRIGAEWDMTELNKALDQYKIIVR